jgi:arsenate reductase
MPVASDFDKPAIVVTPKGVKLCRPSEAVLEILPNPDIGRFVKEDGEVITSRGSGARH